MINRKSKRFYNVFAVRCNESKDYLEVSISTYRKGDCDATVQTYSKM
jgi:hypothetical protein